MKEIEKKLKRNKEAYPFWNSLSDKEKEIVNSIAMQIPISCEDVAVMFLVHCDSDRQRTANYIYQRYGFVVN